MTIHYALVGSNDDPLYLDFWPIISKVWKKIFNIVPVLGLITTEKEEIIHDEYGIIVKLNPIEGYTTGLLSQLVRFYLPKLLNGNCIISDIDMIPLSKKYFIDDVIEFSENDFVIMSSHHPQTIGINQYPMCYVLGNDKIFKRLFKLNDDWSTFISKIPNHGWFTDQIYLYNKIKENENFNYKYPEREGGFFQNRIDRINWDYEPEKINKDFYIDCHSLRPYSFYKNEINELISLLEL